MDQQEKFVSFLRDVSNGNEKLYQKLKSSAVEQGIKVGDLDDSQLDEVKRQFVRNTVIPGVSNALVQSDERQFKFYADVAKKANSYLDNKFDRDYDTLKKYYGEKYTASKINDEKWLNFQAALQGTSPEVIKKELENAFADKQKKIAEEAQEKAAKETAEARSKIWNDGDGMLYKAAKTVSGFVAPELTNLAEERIKTGTDKGSIGKAVLKDVAFGVGSLALGGVAGKLAGAATKGAGLFGRIAGNAIAGGASSAASEAGREYASDYEEMDPAKIASTFVAGGTVSGIAKKAASGSRNVSGGSSIGKGFREAVYGGSDSAAEGLKKSWSQTVKNFKHNATKMERQGTKEMIEKRAEELGVKPETVRKYIKEGKTPELYSGNVSEKTVKKHPDLFPEEIQSMKTVKTRGDKIAEVAKGSAVTSTENVIGPRTPMAAEEKKTPIKKQAEEMGVDETTIRMWNANFKPHDEAGANLYEQWKKRYK